MAQRGNKPVDLSDLGATPVDLSDLGASIQEKPPAVDFKAMRFPGQTPPVAAPAPSLLERAKAHLPSMRTALRVGGGMIGGAIGAGLGAAGTAPTIAGVPIGATGGAAMGGAAGSSIGESTYQLVQRLRGQPVTETGGDAAQAQTGALIQGATQEVLPAYLTTKFPQALRQSAANKVAESVQAGQQPLGVKRNVAKVAEDVIDDFPVTASTAKLLTKLEERAAEAGRLNESAYSEAARSGIKIKSGPVVQALEQKMGQLMHNQAPIPGMESKISAYRQVIDWLKENPSFTVEDFRKAKQAWDSAVNYNRADLAPDPMRSAVLEEAAGAVRSVIHNVFPKTAKSDRNAHVWTTLYQTLQRASDKSIGSESLMQIIPRSAVGGSIGAGAAMMQGQSPYEGALIGGTLGMLSKTAGWNTLSVKERAMLIRALESEMGRAASKVGSAGLSATIEEGLQR